MTDALKARTRRQQRKDLGICPRCEAKPDAPYVYCIDCRADTLKRVYKNPERRARNKARNSQTVYQARMAANCCPRCGDGPLVRFKTCLKCRKRCSQQRRNVVKKEATANG